jgi:hypothetical protein
MPLKRGTSKKTLSENIREFHKGKTFAKTKSKFGKKRANKQAVAVAYAQRRKSARKKRYTVASSITIQNTINFCLALIEQQPVLINGLEPALSSATLVLQTMLGPPFAWAWNRSTLSYQTNGSDWTQNALTKFGHLEGGTVQLLTGGNAWEVEVKNLLFADTQQARPKYISPLIDDGMGNITFRLTPSPDQGYNVILIMQNKAPVVMSLAQTWAPVPDERNYICQWGFLALMSLIGNDARFNEYNAKFITSLLGAQGGLTDLERNIFLSNWMRVLSQAQGTQLAVSERYKARET